MILTTGGVHSEGMESGWLAHSREKPPSEVYRPFEAMIQEPKEAASVDTEPTWPASS